MHRLLGKAPHHRVWDEQRRQIRVRPRPQIKLRKVKVGIKRRLVRPLSWSLRRALRQAQDVWRGVPWLLLLLLMLVLLVLVELGLRLRLRLGLQRGLRLCLLLCVRVRVRPRVGAAAAAAHCDFGEEVERRLCLRLSLRRRRSRRRVSRRRRIGARRLAGCSAVCVGRVCARAFFDLHEALLQALGNKVEFAVWRLRVARDDGVKHCYEALRVDFDCEIFLLDYAAYFA